MVRESDTLHDKECFELHHDSDKRLSVLEVKVETNTITLNNSIKEIIDRQQIHEEKFERMLERLTSALVGIELKMERFMSKEDAANNTFEKFIKYGIPVVVAIAGGIWALLHVQ